MNITTRTVKGEDGGTRILVRWQDNHGDNHGYLDTPEQVERFRRRVENGEDPHKALAVIALKVGNPDIVKHAGRGGKNRSKNLSKRALREIGLKGAKARWGKKAKAGASEAE